MMRLLRSRQLWRFVRGILFFAMALSLIGGCASVLYLVFPPPSMNILIVGMDNGEQGRAAFESNTMLLVGVNPALLRVSVIALSGDMLVAVPDAGLVTVNQLGDDSQHWRSAITQTFGIRIDRYVRLDFETFAALVDAVDGIVVDVERVLEDERYPDEDTVDDVRRVRFESGIQRMDSERALEYARIIGDYGMNDRVRRQGQLLLALSLPLRNPAVWPAVLNVLMNEAETDLNLWDMITLTPPLILTAGRYETLTIDEDYAAAGVGGRHIDFEAFSQWLQIHFG